MACFLLFPVTVYAGKYAASYTYTFTPPANAGNPVSATNAQTSPRFSSSSYASGTMTLAVTPSLTWSLDARADTSVAPKMVSYVETGATNMEVTDASNPPQGITVTTQIAKDGLGDTQTNPALPQYGVFCSGYHAVGPVSPASLPGRTVTSSFSYTAQGTLGNGGGLASYALYPVYITLAGQDLATGNALTGQQIMATLAMPNSLPPGTKITSYTWSFMGGTKGNPIKGWDGKNNTVQLTPWLPADFSQTDTSGNGFSGVNSLSFYDEIADTITVMCAINLTFPDGTTGTVTAQSDKVTFVKPTVTWTVGQSYNKIVPGFFTDYPNQQFGARELWGKITIAEPAALIKGTPGTGCMVQVAKLIRSFARTAQNGKPSSFSKISIVNGDGSNSMVAGPTGLDVAFPYPFGSVMNKDGTFTSVVNSKYTWSANTDGYSGDQPDASFTLVVNDGGGNQWYSSSTNDNFNTWIMYCPPANGLGTIYVPLQTLNWYWGGNASLSGGVWSVSQGPQFTPGMPGDTPTPPSWKLYIPYNFSIGP